MPKHNCLVISGDLNAKLGRENARFTYNTETNHNGEHLIDLMYEFSLFAANTSFMSPKGQLWTLIPHRWPCPAWLFNLQEKVEEPCERGKSIFNIQLGKLRPRSDLRHPKLNLRVPKKAVPHPMKRIHWKEVFINRKMSKDFAV